MSEFFKLGMIDKADNLIILNPVDLDGTYDKKVWCALGSNTSNAVLHFLSQKQYRVYTLGDYLYREKNIEDAARNSSYDMSRCYDDYLDGKVNLGKMTYRQNAVAVKKFRDELYNRIMADIIRLYQDMWETRAGTNVKVSPNWTKYDMMYDWEEGCDWKWDIFNMEAKVHNPLYRGTVNFQTQVLANAIFPLTQCGESNLLHYCSGPFMGCYLKFGEWKNKPNCAHGFQKYSIGRYQL